MINFHHHRLDEREIIGISDVDVEFNKKSSRAFCTIYFKTYPVKIATKWETNKKMNCRIPFLTDHMHLKHALSAGDFGPYKQYKTKETEKFIIDQLFPKARNKRMAKIPVPEEALEKQLMDDVTPAG